MKQRWTPTVSHTVDLGYDQLLLLENRPRTRLKVVYGGIWLTEEGMPRDVFAASGEEVALVAKGLAVVESLGYARIEVTEPPRRRAALLPVLRRLAQRVFASAVRIGPAPAGERLVSGGCRS